MTSSAFASQEFDRDSALRKKRSDDNKARFFEFLDYEQKVYSSSTGAELGEQTSFSAAIRFIPDDNAFVRLRLNVDPKKNVFENQTSDLEVLANHSIDNFEFQGDLTLNFDAPSKGSDNNGAVAFGPDTDSDYSFIAYHPSELISLYFYPYNFAAFIQKQCARLASHAAWEYSCA